jgi:ABC-2 type transport system ATP-binding protein
MLELVKLRKEFNEVKAPNGIDFRYDKRGVLTVIGQNGAGKTTLLRILSCQLLPTDGRAYLLGMDVVKDYEKLRNVISMLPQDIRPFSYTLTPRDYIFSYLLMRGYSIGDARRRTSTMLDEMELREVADTQIIRLSGGTAKRVFVAMALSVDADVYLLDEPTAGLDARSKHIFWEMMRKIVSEGKSAIVASHFLEETSKNSDYIMVLRKGSLMAHNTPEKLVESVFGGMKRKVIVRNADLSCISDIEHRKCVIGDSCYIYSDKIDYILDKLVSNNISAEVRPIELEDAVIVGEFS